MLWETGPRSVLVHIIKLQKEEEEVETSARPSARIGHGSQLATVSKKESVSVTCIYFFPHRVFETINISSGQREKNLSSPEGSVRVWSVHAGQRLVCKAVHIYPHPCTPFSLSGVQSVFTCVRWLCAPCVSFFRKAVLKTHYVRYWMATV